MTHRTGVGGLESGAAELSCDTSLCSGGTAHMEEKTCRGCWG